MVHTPVTQHLEQEFVSLDSLEQIVPADVHAKMVNVISMALADVQLDGKEKIVINVFHYQVVKEVAQNQMNVFALQVLKENIVMKDNSSLTGFICECEGDYAGQFCQVEAKTCRDLPCKNGAPCLEGNDGYFCECTNNWEGKICDIPLTFCRADSCLNGAECEYAPSTARGYTCKCAAGFYGERCENKISDWKVCRNHQCQNNGNCFRKLGKPACNCTAGYEGEHCEIDLCQCSNGGICDRSSTSHKCICPEGFEGVKCQIKSFRASRISLQDPQSSVQDQTTVWPFLGIILVFIIFSVLISLIPKYLKLQKRRQNPSDSLPSTTSAAPSNQHHQHHRNEFKQLELQTYPTTKISSSFCSSAPPGICCQKSSTCICSPSAPSLQNSFFENQYILDPANPSQSLNNCGFHQRPTTLLPPLSTPEPLRREAEKRFSQKNLVSPSGCSTTSSNEYEDIIIEPRRQRSSSSLSSRYHESV
uniref:EGF-like domain-containing protein n=1 Tax=Panagrolaimus sp. ES5 TaxID=591445 RepID=A0AC34GU35_9BILA